METDEQQWQRRHQQWRREQQYFARIEKSKLYWIFDPRIEEIHRIDARETKQAYNRMRIRYFFSWEGLSKFLLAPVFKVGLTSIVVTPFLANIYIFFRDALGSIYDFKFPTQMALLFFSGLSVVLARSIYEWSCPKVVKAHINSSSLDTQNLQNARWLQVELEYCLLQYVMSLPKTEEYVIGRQIKRQQSKIKEGTRQVDDITAGEANETRYRLVIPELAERRVGFDKYGVWLIQNLLLRVAKVKECKLFVSWTLPPSFSECNSPAAVFDTGYPALHLVYFRVAYKDTEEQKGINHGDFLLEVHETSHHVLDDFPKDALIYNYFNGMSKITDLGANDVVKEFIAENENYWKPYSRIAITTILSLSIIFLLVFLSIQTMIVCKAIDFSFLRDWWLWLMRW